MANDRLWLRCKICHETLFLGKYYPSMIAQTFDFKRSEESCDFINLHLEKCFGARLDLDDFPIEFVTEETNPDWPPISNMAKDQTK